MTLGEDLRAAADVADQKDEQLLTALDTISAKNDAIEQLDLEIADLTQKLADCEGGTTPPEPPPTTATDFGACATKGGSPSQVPVKWGKGAALRTFSTSGFSAPTVVPDAGTWHHSWKPAVGSPINATNVAAACKPMRPGDVVEVWHEADVKFSNGSLTAAQASQVRDMKSWFFDAVESVRPDLLVWDTFGAWIFDDKSGKYPGTANDPATAAYWASAKAHGIGVDCDGYSNLTKYPDFTSVIKNVKAYIAAHGFDFWAVPEFIHPRISTDPTGSQRASFFTTHGTKFRDGGAHFVTLFDYDYRPNQEVQAGSPEFTAWRAFI